MSIMDDLYNLIIVKLPPINQIDFCKFDARVGPKYSVQLTWIKKEIM